MAIGGKSRAPLLIALPMVIAAYFLAAVPVDNSLSADDRQAIAALKTDAACLELKDFAGEIDCIRSAQRRIQQSVADTKCASADADIEPGEFIRRGYGCCVDRARFIEKTLRAYGFETRRVALYAVGRYGIFGLGIPGTPSHASSEVKTTRGWLGVDSIHPFLLLTKDQQALTYADLGRNRANISDIVAPESFYAADPISVYGLYSRHGMFHGADLPAPEINLAEFRFNFFGDGPLPTVKRSS